MVRRKQSSRFKVPSLICPILNVEFEFYELACLSG